MIKSLSSGHPTSMNQALINGVFRADTARDIRKSLLEIVASWFYTPVLASFVLFVLNKIISTLLEDH